MSEQEYLNFGGITLRGGYNSISEFSRALLNRYRRKPTVYCIPRGQRCAARPPWSCPPPPVWTGERRGGSYRGRR